MGISAQNPEVLRHEWNQDKFQIMEFAKNVHTGIPCQVKAVYPLAPGEAAQSPDGLSGVVDVRMAIEKYDNEPDPKPIPRDGSGTIAYNVPYFRIQGGNCALVIDPEVGDWGWITFGERDISKWKRVKEIEVPPTRRMLTQSDGGYIPGILNTPPEIYIRVHKSGITIQGKDQPITAVTTGKITLDAPDIHLRTGGGFGGGGADFRMQGGKMWLYAQEINQRRAEVWSEEPPTPTGGTRGPTMPDE